MCPTPSIPMFLPQALTDYMFLPPSQEAAASLAAANYTVYNFIMTHRDSSGVVWGGPHLFEKASDLGMKTPLLKTGVSHGDEQLFLFSSQEYNYETETFSSSFVSLFVNFISRGRPQGVEGERSEWTPVVAGEPVGYYNISLQPSMVHTPYNAKGRNFWLQTIPLLETFLETGAASHPADVKDEL
ncbi:uncharacterized protein LOC121857731 [Homarus americanus]|uniref:uncharacterized protein LOC121857731 n=1 Tax=Homarus americanus TaxID=6706 RepID=UPI001C43B5F9|nr:uncharacterized protein LOC121857731 [Homarus americanus]